MQKLSMVFGLLLLLVFTGESFGEPGEGAVLFGTESSGLADRVDALIFQLGDANYLLREQAERELESLGVEAFDALRAAQQHENIEIAHRVRHLIQGIAIPWVQPSDSPTVTRLVRDYSRLPYERRGQLLAQLLEFDGVVTGGEWEFFCRVARFDSSEILSKRAALILMNINPPSDENRVAWVNRLNASLGSSSRPGAQWCRGVGEYWLDSSVSLETWRSAIEEETTMLVMYPSRTSSEVVEDLQKWFAFRLFAAGRVDEAFVVFDNLLNCARATDEELLEHLEWLIENQADGIALKLADQHSERIDNTRDWQYQLATIYQKLGEEEKAEVHALSAFEVADIEFGEVSLELSHHLQWGYKLQSLGQLAWSEREYRKVIEVGNIEDWAVVLAHVRIAEIYFDLCRCREAAEEMKLIYDQVAEAGEGSVRRVHPGRREEWDEIEARMHYFFAVHYEEEGDRQRHIESLERSLEKDPHGSEVLIALYHLTDVPPDDRERYLAALNAEIEALQAIVLAYRAGNGPHLSPFTHDSRHFHSTLVACNGYAWLVSNTEGDLEEAMESSLLAVAMRPESAGYLDTLSQCYYALGDFEKAVATQRKVVDLSPQSPFLHRRLEFFEQELADSLP